MYHKGKSAQDELAQAETPRIESAHTATAPSEAAPAEPARSRSVLSSTWPIPRPSPSHPRRTPQPNTTSANADRI
jgi:hypothetical protein